MMGIMIIVKSMEDIIFKLIIKKSVKNKENHERERERDEVKIIYI